MTTMAPLSTATSQAPTTTTTTTTATPVVHGVGTTKSNEGSRRTLMRNALFGVVIAMVLIAVVASLCIYVFRPRRPQHRVSKPAETRRSPPLSDQDEAEALTIVAPRGEDTPAFTSVVVARDETREQTSQRFDQATLDADSGVLSTDPHTTQTHQRSPYFPNPLQLPRRAVVDNGRAVDERVFDQLARASQESSALEDTLDADPTDESASGETTDTHTRSAIAVCVGSSTADSAAAPPSAYGHGVLGYTYATRPAHEVASASVAPRLSQHTNTLHRAVGSSGTAPRQRAPAVGRVVGHTVSPPAHAASLARTSNGSLPPQQLTPLRKLCGPHPDPVATPTTPAVVAHEEEDVVTPAAACHRPSDDTTARAGTSFSLFTQGPHAELGATEPWYSGGGGDELAETGSSLASTAHSLWVVGKPASSADATLSSLASTTYTNQRDSSVVVCSSEPRGAVTPALAAALRAVVGMDATAEPGPATPLTPATAAVLANPCGPNTASTTPPTSHRTPTRGGHSSTQRCLSSHITAPLNASYPAPSAHDSQTGTETRLRLHATRSSHIRGLHYTLGEDEDEDLSPEEREALQAQSARDQKFARVAGVLQMHYQRTQEGSH